MTTDMPPYYQLQATNIAININWKSNKKTNMTTKSPCVLRATEHNSGP